MREIEVPAFATPSQGVAGLFGGPAFDTGAGAVCSAHVGSSVRISRIRSWLTPLGAVPDLSPSSPPLARRAARRGRIVEAPVSRARRSRAASPGEARFQSNCSCLHRVCGGGYSDTTAQSQLTAGVCHATLHSCAPAFPTPRCMQIACTCRCIAARDGRRPPPTCAARSRPPRGRSQRRATSPPCSRRAPRREEQLQAQRAALVLQPRRARRPRRAGASRLFLPSSRTPSGPPHAAADRETSFGPAAATSATSVCTRDGI